jgi:catechol 2,3-dioxygenase-like lactoylglutathione lyase family enzyme
MLLHADLIVRSMDVALNFYCNQCGFSVVDDALFRGKVVQSLSNHHCDAVRLVLLKVAPVGAMIELVEYQVEPARQARTDQDPTLPTGWVSIAVRDLSAHIEILSQRGLRPTSEIFTVCLPKSGAADVVFYDDPDGNRLEFVQAKGRM